MVAKDLLAYETLLLKRFNRLWLNIIIMDMALRIAKVMLSSSNLFKIHLSYLLIHGLELT